MLRWRLVAAAAIVGPLLMLLWLDDQWNAGRPGIWLGLLAILISLMAAHELNELLQQAGLAVSALANLVAVFCVTAFSLGPLLWVDYPDDGPLGRTGWTLIGLFAAVAWLFAHELYRYREPGQSIQRLAGGALAVVYLGLMFACLLLLRTTLPARLGIVALVATIWIVKVSDAGAYFLGRKFGRTKFSRVSPKKSVEGLVGGLAAAVLGVWLVRAWLLPTFAPDHQPGSLPAYLAYAACLTAAGLLGDLSESLLKRDVQRKDSSNWLPGLGGILDVTDSLLAVAPISLLWWSMDLL